jgi:UDP-4-amino-4,6-dideoxy-N-acetyl-beta-L-altrosamine N-acetyltransferase
MTFSLRELARSDLSFINTWRNDPELIAQLASPFRFIGQEVDDAWFNAYLAARSNQVRLAICRDADQPIGAVYLLNIDWLNRSAEFAIWIGDKTMQGCGAGEFSTRAAVKHAFTDLNLHRLYLTVLPTNTRAIHLYEKVGFVVEGRLRAAVFKQGQFVDMVQMSLLASDSLPT